MRVGSSDHLPGGPMRPEKAPDDHWCHHHRGYYSGYPIPRERPDGKIEYLCPVCEKVLKVV